MGRECIWCPDWAPQIEKVNAPIILQQLRTGRSDYDGKPFKFCPWCGHELHEVAAKTVDAPHE